MRPRAATGALKVVEAVAGQAEPSDATYVPTAEAAPSAQGWSPPPEFDGYQLRRLIGCGSMGRVYLAYDSLLERPVAIKFIQALDASAAQKERFFAEARAVARLQHPNVVTVYRVGEVDGRPYLSSEFVEGMPLDQAAVPLPWREVLRIGIDLSRGLAAAHRRGVLHRDVKAANAMLARDGQVKLLDFGLAKLVDASPGVEPGDTLGAGAPAPHEPGLTADGALVGTPLYLAPETWGGESATFRSDVYACGVLLYFLCAGRHPSEAPTLGELRALVCGRPAPPLEDEATVDPRLAAVVARCLERGPEQRFANGDELRDALEQIATTTHEAAVPPGSPYRGLSAFEGEDRALFFGRDPEIRTVLERLRSESFILVMGTSGVGKSSLCRAGVLPRVTGGAMGDGRAWSTATMRPGQRPLSALCAVLAPFLSVDEESLAAQLRREPAVLGRLLRRPRPGDAGLLLFIDQLEELVTLADQPEAAVVSEALSSLYAPALRLRVLATTRADFLTRIAALPGLGAELARTLYLLCPLGADSLREAVVGPAAVSRFHFETEAMVDTLVASAGADGALPLLQFALAELWDQRDPTHRVIPEVALERIGGVAGALSRHADRVVARMLPEERAATPGLLADLVRPDGTRARCDEAALLRGDERSVRGALDALVRGRLLVAHASPGGTAYEVAHEALSRGWPTLKRWLDEDREGQVLRDRLVLAVAEWERLGRSREALWSARQLAESARLASSPLQAPEAAFLAASGRAHRRRFWLRTAAIAATLLTVAGVFGAMKIDAELKLRGKVEALLTEASAHLSHARALAAQAQARRTAAFGHFDAADSDQGEARWAESLAASRDADRALGQTSRALEAALALKSDDARVRELLADTVFDRAALAEKAADPARVTEFIDRLPLYDEGGKRTARWNAPAVLSVGSTPPAAGARLETHRPDEAGRLALVATRDLGATPVSHLALPAGSYVLVLTSPGRVDVRLPLRLGRGEAVEVQVALPAATDVPSGFAYIPAGRFISGSTADDNQRKGFLHAAPAHPVWTDAYLVARHETTWAEYLAYLRALPPAERTRRLPRVDKGGFQGALSLTQGEDGLFTLALQPAGQAYAAREGERVSYAGRETRVTQDWLLMPVTGVDEADAAAYAGWLGASGRVPGARLCDEREWERAARGADAREYPHGDALEPDDANLDETYGKNPLALGPDEVGSHPASRSPYGLEDTSGNAWEWTRASTPGEHVVRGGSFYFGRNSARATNRELVEPSLRDVSVGLRVCASLR